MENKKDKIDISMDIKKFFKLIYRDLGQGEYIRVFQNSKDKKYNKVSFFNDIDDLVSYSNNKKNYIMNTYFQLATTDGEGGAAENLKYRYCLGFDFDKKDLGQAFNHKDILNLFKKANIHYHALIDSGNGFHVYICIKKTNNIKMVQEVQNVLCDKLGADKNAIKSTQILRVPYTYNVKGDKPKSVKIVNMDNKNDESFRPYDIEFLYNKNCRNDEVKTGSSDKQIKYTLNNTNIPKCIENILSNGSKEEDHNRYADLQKIIVTLRQRNKPLGEITQVCKEWAYKSQYDDNLDYRINNIYDNLNYISMDCKSCQHRQECYSVVISDFNYSNDDKTIKISETHISKLKASSRKGVKVMKANDLLVYSILKNHNDGLYREEITTELTYTKKKEVKNVALSDKTLRETLKSLEENGFINIELIGKKKLYKLKEVRSKIELTYIISYSATFECVKGNISTEELKLYNYMRYLHHKEQRENPKALKGNLFQFNQVDIAKDLGVTQGRISQMIENLLDEKLLGIWYRQASKNNGFEYNIYRLNY